MDKLIELLKQIQELAGVGVDALQGAAGGQHGGGAPHEGPAEDKAEGGESHEPPAEAKGEQPKY